MWRWVNAAPEGRNARLRSLVQKAMADEDKGLPTGMPPHETTPDEVAQYLGVNRGSLHLLGSLLRSVREEIASRRTLEGTPISRMVDEWTCGSAKHKYLLTLRLRSNSYSREVDAYPRFHRWSKWSGWRHYRARESNRSE
jgi:hypothetical protein